MRTLWQTAMAALCGVVWTQGQTIALYENFGLVNDSPSLEIDAFAFANYGTFQVSPFFGLYDFSNTRHYTNRGSMSGGNGFQFDTVSSTNGARRPAVNFVNDYSGTIQGAIVLISATNVHNQGLIQVSSGGQLQIKGGNVDLTRGSLNMGTTAGQGQGDILIDTNYFTDVGLPDYWWGGTTNGDMNITNFLIVDPVGGVGVITPPHSVTNAVGQSGTVQWGLFNPLVAVNTNRVSDTNWIIQAAFVGYDSNYTSARVSFSSQGATDPAYRVVNVSLAMSFTNSVTGQIAQDTLYVADRMVANTNYNFLATNTQTLFTYRPGNYRVSRVPFTQDGFTFLGGQGGNAVLTPELFYNTNYSNVVVTNFWAAYSADLVALDAVSGEASVWGLSNSVGRMEIGAKSLNLENSKMRGNTLLSIQADHLVSTENSEAIAPNYIFDLASTNGNLRITEFTAPTSRHFGGFFNAWSAYWTNNLATVTNVVEPDPNDPSLTVTNTVTNVIDLVFHAFVLDATSIGYTQQTAIHNLRLQATNVVVDDNLNLVGSALFEAPSLTLNGYTLLQAGAGRFACSNAPNTLYFTNNGTFEAINSICLGADRPVPYAAIVNHGTIVTPGIKVWTTYLQNSGTIDASGPLYLDAKIAKLESGYAFAGGDVTLVGSDLKAHGYTNSTPGSISLFITNSITDSGPLAGNAFLCNNGFFMPQRPRLGDLLGSRFQSTAGGGTAINHVWSATDRGHSVTGFSNNVALGQLTLTAGQNGQLLFHGGSGGTNYALYTDYLDLRGFVQNAYAQGRLGDYLKIDPNLTIYYAYANVPVEQLDGALGGRLRWVRDFVGPNSGLEVLLPSGKTIRVNRGLRESLIIDSDGDGLANGNDLTPFSEPVVQATVVRTGVAKAVIHWTGAPLTTYQVEYTEDLGEGTWSPLGSVSNPEMGPRELAVEDALSAASATRYYRVRFNP